MKTSESDVPKSKAYTPFWAITVVFAALTLLQCLQLRDDYKARAELLATQDSLSDTLLKAKQIEQITEGVTRDIYVLAAKSEEARRIAGEFNIRYTQLATAQD